MTVDGAAEGPARHAGRRAPQRHADQGGQRESPSSFHPAGTGRAAAGACRPAGGDRRRARADKAFCGSTICTADGVVESHTAFLQSPHAAALEHTGDPVHRSVPLWQPDALTQAFTAADGARDWRPGTTHLRPDDPADIPRIAEPGVTAVPQPYWFLMDDYYRVPAAAVPRQASSSPRQGRLPGEVAPRAGRAAVPAARPCDPPARTSVRPRC